MDGRQERIRNLRETRDKISAEIGILGGAEVGPEPAQWGQGGQANCCERTAREESPEEIIEDLFTYQAPGDEATVLKFQIVRDAAKHLALQIWKACPYGRDRTNAIDTLRQAVMLANASIALNGRSI